MNLTTVFFIAYGAALAGQLGDCITTEASLSHGLVEGNPIAKWLTSKIGNTGLTLLKCIGLAQALPILAFTLAGAKAGIATAGAVAFIGFFAAIENYLLMKKNHIPL